MRPLGQHSAPEAAAAAAAAAAHRYCTVQYSTVALAAPEAASISSLQSQYGRGRRDGGLRPEPVLAPRISSDTRTTAAAAAAEARRGSQLASRPGGLIWFDLIWLGTGRAARAAGRKFAGPEMDGALHPRQAGRGAGGAPGAAHFCTTQRVAGRREIFQAQGGRKRNTRLSVLHRSIELILRGRSGGGRRGGQGPAAGR